MYTWALVRKRARHGGALGAILLTATFAIALLTAGGNTAFADNGDNIHDYEDGPLTADDFQGSPPDPLPTEGDVTLYAQTVVGSDYQYGGTYAPDGEGGYTYTPDEVTVSAYMDESQSWMDPNHKDDAELLDHEQGHMDLEEAAMRDAQAKINEMLANGELRGEGATPEEAEADLQSKIDEIIHDHETTPDGENIHDHYDDKTEHGTNEQEQEKHRKKHKDKLKKPSKDDTRKKEPEAKSEVESSGGGSISFDATTDVLSILHDSIVYDPAYGVASLDPVIDAEVVMPSFTLAGQDSDGEYFFSADATDPQMLLQEGATTYLSAYLGYMRYDPGQNMLYGLTMGMEYTPGQSTYVDEMVASMGTGFPSLCGINFYPDSDLGSMTSGFSASASGVTGTNGIAQRALDVPEPTTLALASIGLVMALGATRKRRR